MASMKATVPGIAHWAELTLKIAIFKIDIDSFYKRTKESPDDPCCCYFRGTRQLLRYSPTAVTHLVLSEHGMSMGNFRNLCWISFTRSPDLHAPGLGGRSVSDKKVN